MDDKRNFDRVSMEVPALIECLRPKRRRKLLLKTTNLSASGVYFNTPKPFPKGAEVKVEIFLHDRGASPLTVSCPNWTVSIPQDSIRRVSPDVARDPDLSGR